MCAEESRRPVGGTRLFRARRADRRLREVARDADGIGGEGVPAPLGDGRRVEHACLALKARAAESVALTSLQRLGSSQREQAEGLDRRIARHAMVADDALERAAARLAGVRAEQSPGLPMPALRGVGWAALAAAAIVLTVVLTVRPDPLGRGATPPSAAGDVLGGVPQVTSTPVPASVPAPAPPAPPVPPVPPVPTSIAIGFDDLRMGSGIGTDWQQTSGDPTSVSLAAFPTAIDRSARLTVSDGEPARTCTTLQPAVEDPTQLSFELWLESPGAMGEVALLNADGLEILVISASGNASSVRGATAILAAGQGTTPETWHRVALTVGEGSILVSMGGPDGERVLGPIDLYALGAVEAICLGNGGLTGSAVHFDDFVITNE